MYKITTVIPNNKLGIFRKSGDLNLSPEETEGTSTMITTVREDESAVMIITGFCEMVSDGRAKSLTITKDDDDNAQTEV